MGQTSLLKIPLNIALLEAVPFQLFILLLLGRFMQLWVEKEVKGFLQMFCLKCILYD